MKKKMTFALCFCNRGFMPGELIYGAREDMVKAVTAAGHDYIMMDAELTRYGGVETRAEGKLYAEWLRKHQGEYDGVIFSMPIFVDENGAAEALRDAGVPILMQAYPDEIGKMDFAHRRDAMCGKLAMCNLLRQAGITYSLTERFCVDPLSDEFRADLDRFAAVCRVVGGMKRVNIGAIGARTTAFKTVRCDEIAFQRMGINVETIDMSRVFAEMDALTECPALENKRALYASLSDFGKYPPEKLNNIAKLGVVIDRLIAEYSLDGIAIRCWDELQKRYGVAPCLILGELNERGISAACELDITNAVMMRAVGLAANYPVMLLDVNNNCENERNKAILFHCGPAPMSLMRGRGEIREHLMFKKSYGAGSGVGINYGQFIVDDVTLGSFKTENGKLCAFVSEGRLTEEQLPDVFFGCGSIFEKKDNGTDANGMLTYMAKNGYRHHVAVTRGHVGHAIVEAFRDYLGYEIDLV